MKKFLFMILLLALGGGGLYLAGRLPERQGRAQAEQAAAAAQSQLAEAQARVRLAELQDQVFMALHHLADKNFGLARDQATRFFDGARAEMARSPKPEVRTALEAILASRDAVIAALTQGDSSAVGALYGVLERLRQAAGRPALPALAAAGLPPTPAPLPLPSPLPQTSPSVPSSPTPFAPSPITTFPPPTTQN